MHVSLQRHAQKCMKRAHGVGSRPRHTKSIVSPQFRTSDQHEVTKGFPVELKNLRFTTVLDVRRARSDERVARAPSKFACISPQFWASGDHFLCEGARRALNFTTVLSVRQSLFALRVARRHDKFAFHHSFGRPTSTK